MPKNKIRDSQNILGKDYFFFNCIFTPHAHVRAGGYVIGAGVHIYINKLYIIMFIAMFVDKKKFESHFSDRLAFSNIRSTTSRRIYRLALPLRVPETLSLLSKSRISIFNAHLLYLSVG